MTARISSRPRLTSHEQVSTRNAEQRPLHQRTKRQEFRVVDGMDAPASTAAGRALRGEAKIPAIQQPAVPSANLQPGQSGPEVEQLQQLLVQLGYLDAANADALGTYGPATTAAVARLQQDLVAKGLMTAEGMATGPGFAGPRTRWALHTMMGQTPPANVAAFAPNAAPGAPQPGAAPANTGGPGTPSTQGPAPSPGAPVDGGWDPSFYVDQLAYPNGNQNCGPATLSMMMKKFGLRPVGNDAALIAEMAQVAGTNQRGWTGPYQWADAANSLGLPTKVYAANHSAANVDTNQMVSALQSGKGVVANLNTRVGGHYVTVYGMDANGNFLIADPSRLMPEVMSPRELAQAIAANDNGGHWLIVG